MSWPLKCQFVVLFVDGFPVDVSHSSNVFLERFAQTEALETPMYVTNNQQMQDFIWHRPSGINVMVSINDVFLIPEYRQPQHIEGDSEWFERRVGINQETLKFFSITTSQYCRY